MCVQPVYKVSEDGSRQAFQCGRCFECLTRRREEWTNRIALEAEYNPPAVFLTLTYSPDFCDGQLHYRDHIVPFLRNFRRDIEPRKLRYCCVGEYGGRTHRPHYHMILFGLALGEVDDIVIKRWKLGHHDLGHLEYGGAKYVAKYHILAKISKLPYWQKEDEQPLMRNAGKYFDDCYDEYVEEVFECTEAPEFFTMSRNPGIGASCLTDELVESLRSRPSPRMTVNNKIVSIPRYLRNKIYDDSMKEEVYEQLKEQQDEHIRRFCNQFDVDYSNTYDSPYMVKRKEIDIYKRTKYNHKKNSHGLF